MSSPRVLVVDDSRLTRTIIKNALSAAGYEIAGEAVNGHEGIALAKSLKPDLVTVDFTMPEKGGLESLEEIRAAHPPAKVIVVTALGGQKLLQEDAKKAGALAMIAKPFNPFDLVRVANGLLGRREGAVQEPRGLVLPVAEAYPNTIGNKLTQDQIDDLMEVGNIGAGNAASRLSDLIRQRCLISPPQVAFLKPVDILNTFTADDYFMASLGIKILGDIPAIMVVVLRRDQAAAVVRYMTGDEGSNLSMAALSALKQVGEFMTRAFSQAVNQFLLDRVQEALPDVSIADASLDLKALLKDDAGGPHLLIHCGFSDLEKTFEGKLAYLLSPDAQKTVLERLQKLLSLA